MTKPRILVAIALLLAVFSGQLAHAGNASLTCTPPTTYTDGSAIGTAPITYNLYQGVTTAALTKAQGPLTSCSASVTNLAVGTTFYWAMTAVVAGVESDKSAVVHKAIVAPVLTPTAPGNLVVDPANPTAYFMTQQENKYVAVPVGTFQAGAQCDATQSINGYNVVDRAKVTWYGTAKPLVVVGQCT